MEFGASGDTMNCILNINLFIKVTLCARENTYLVNLSKLQMSNFHIVLEMKMDLSGWVSSAFGTHASPSHSVGTIWRRPHAWDPLRVRGESISTWTYCPIEAPYLTNKRSRWWSCSSIYCESDSGEEAVKGRVWTTVRGGSYY